MKTLSKCSGAFLLTALFIGPAPVAAGTCLYISSYHAGYQWNDGIEQGLHAALGDKCRLEKFYLDTNREQNPAHAENLALQAKALIEQSKPDVVIAADDAVSKYLIKPYFKDAALPVVFCGINDTVEPYGYPYRNTTGMVEIAPIKPMLLELKKFISNPQKVIYLSPDIVSQHKEFELNRRVYAEHGIAVKQVLVKTMQEWERAFVAAQDADILIIGSNGGLPGWNEASALKLVQSKTRAFTVTNMEWMTRYAMFAMTKIAAEQGEWAGQAAVAILAGTAPADIPIVVNRRWNVYVNTALAPLAPYPIPDYLMRKAIKLGN